MHCSFNYATFAYYATKAAWVTVMTVFIALSLPETKGIPLESMSVVWARHWNWKRSVVQDQRKSDVALT
jgi:MFS transporter, SP family, sugar:H+ symporter